MSSQPSHIPAKPSSIPPTIPLIKRDCEVRDFFNIYLYLIVFSFSYRASIEQFTLKDNRVKHPMAKSQGLLQSSHEEIAVGHFLPRSVFAFDSGGGCFSLHCDPCPTHIRSEDKNANVLPEPWVRYSHILSMPGKFHE